MSILKRQTGGATVATLVIFLMPARLAAQAELVRDPLMDHLVGDWILTGKIAGRDAHHDVKASWVLNRQFLRIDEKTSASAPPGERRYEAIWFLGYDPSKSQYALHLLDLFGAQFAETIGHGTRVENAITFRFDYPDAPLDNTYRWNRDADEWQWLMEQQDKAGAWSSWAVLHLTRRTSRSR